MNGQQDYSEINGNCSNSTKPKQLSVVSEEIIDNSENVDSQNQLMQKNQDDLQIKEFK